MYWLSVTNQFQLQHEIINDKVKEKVNMHTCSTNIFQAYYNQSGAVRESISRKVPISSVVFGNRLANVRAECEMLFEDSMKDDRSGGLR